MVLFRFTVQITAQITVPVHVITLSLPISGAVDISGAHRTLLCKATDLTIGVRLCLVNEQGVDLACTPFSIYAELNEQSSLVIDKATIGNAVLTYKKLGTMEITFTLVPMANVSGVTLMCSDSSSQANQTVNLTAWLGRYACIYLYYIVCPSFVNVCQCSPQDSVNVYTCDPLLSMFPAVLFDTLCAYV